MTQQAENVTSYSPEVVEPEVAVASFRVGYGHYRAARALTEALKKVGVVSTLFDMSSPEYQSLARHILILLNELLGIMYRTCPDFFIRFSGSGASGGMELINKIMKHFDLGSFDACLGEKIKIVVAAHMTPADLTDKKVFMLVLDPYPPLYNPQNENAIFVTPDYETAVGLKNAGHKNVIVTGPFVAPEIVEARKRFLVEARERFLQEAESVYTPISITIATGGSLSHGNEIIALAKSYATAMQNDQHKNQAINKIYVVVGDSDCEMRGGNMKKRMEDLLVSLPQVIHEKFEIIYDKDPVQLVAKADVAMGKSAVVHAKTGELVYVAGGGVAFETFGNDPSLAIQEVKLRGYAEELSRLSGNKSAQREMEELLCNIFPKKRSENVASASDGVETNQKLADERLQDLIKKCAQAGMSALEQGEVDTDEEVKKIFDQFFSGTLYLRRCLGLRIPVHGAEYVASLVKQALQHEQAQKNDALSHA